MRPLRPLTIVFVALLAGCGLSSVLREAREVASPSVTGELMLHVAGGEPVSWKPDVCQSGEHEQFFGFLLGASGSSIVVRAVLDPLNGPGLRITGLEGPTSVVVRPDQCRTLDLNVTPTGWRVNDFNDVSGTLEVSCTSSEGTTVEGAVEVRHCH